MAYYTFNKLQIKLLLILVEAVLQKQTNNKRKKTPMFNTFTFFTGTLIGQEKEAKDKRRLATSSAEQAGCGLYWLQGEAL